MQHASLTSRIQATVKNLNVRQQIAIVYAIVMLLMLLFPPFSMQYQGGSVRAGYGFILSGSGDDDRAIIDALSIAIQLVSVTLIALALWAAASNKRATFDAEPVREYEKRMDTIDDAFDCGDITFKEWSRRHDALLSQQIKAEIVSVMR